jgi:glycosyltransferase involved in cell wall biosynthesis
MFIVPNGVDTCKFQPISSLEKDELREGLGFDTSKNMILSVGHIRKNRDLDIFEQVMKYKDFQVLIIGSSLTRDKEVLESLQRAGCKVVCGYQEKIERFIKLLIISYFL